MIGCIAKPWLLPIAVTMVAVNLASQTKNGVYPTVGRRVGLVELKFPVDAKSADLRQYNRDVLQDIEEKSYTL
jgi:hypothetical protein